MKKNIKSISTEENHNNELYERFSKIRETSIEDLHNTLDTNQYNYTISEAEREKTKKEKRKKRIGEEYRIDEKLKHIKDLSQECCNKGKLSPLLSNKMTKFLEQGLKLKKDIIKHEGDELQSEHIQLKHQEFNNTFLNLKNELFSILHPNYANDIENDEHENTISEKKESSTKNTLSSYDGHFNENKEDDTTTNKTSGSISTTTIVKRDYQSYVSVKQILLYMAKSIPCIPSNYFSNNRNDQELNENIEFDESSLNIQGPKL